MESPHGWAISAPCKDKLGACINFNNDLFITGKFCLPIIVVGQKYGWY